MAIEKLRPSYDYLDERIAQLKQVLPEAFADESINWEVLQEVLGHLIDGENAEHFGLVWPGKREARRLVGVPAQGTLKPIIGAGADEDVTRNIFIEGDNLAVMKLLLKSYASRVKMIYIDPPYNTGEDHVYRDDFRDPVQAFLQKTGQVDEQGAALQTNRKSDGRFHSNWLSMMYPRLAVARQLLSPDGSLWISIDDTEVANLRLMCDELFGEENFVATFVWEKRTTRENRRVFSVNHDFVLCYARNKELFEEARGMLPATEELVGRYSNPDNDPRGDWQSVSLAAQAGHGTPAQFYTITTPSGRKLDPPPGNCWRVTKERLKELIADNRVWFGADGGNVPRRKIYLSEVELGLTPHTLWKAGEVGTTDSAKRAVMNLFDGQSVFDTPKPVELIRRMIQIATSEDDLVMDFFAGSCSTAHAVMEQNAADQGPRRFMMIQLPEVTRLDSDAHQAGYEDIAEIGKERMRRAIHALRNQNGQQLEPESKAEVDLGFRVYRLEHSNFQTWQDFERTEIEALQSQMDMFETPLVDGWQESDLLVEIMLQEGFPLDSAVTYQEDYLSNSVYLMSSDFHEHRLVVCLDEAIQDSTIDLLQLGEHDVFVCLDSALSDQSKVRLADRGNVHVI